jgi:hypothetical protein
VIAKLLARETAVHRDVGAFRDREIRRVKRITGKIDCGLRVALAQGFCNASQYGLHAGWRISAGRGGIVRTHGGRDGE